MGDIVKRISIVVPVYNEEENIAHFAAAVEEVMGRLPYDYELLFIEASDDVIIRRYNA